MIVFTSLVQYNLQETRIVLKLRPKSFKIYVRLWQP